jgi:hypothetical protein
VGAGSGIGRFGNFLSHGDPGTGFEQEFVRSTDSSRRLRSLEEGQSYREHLRGKARERGAVRIGSRQRMLDAALDASSLVGGAASAAASSPELRTNLAFERGIGSASSAAIMSDPRFRSLAEANIATMRSRAASAAAGFAGSGSLNAIAETQGRQQDLRSLMGQAQIQSRTAGTREERSAAAQQAADLERQILDTMRDEQNLQRQMATDRIAAERSVISTLQQEKEMRLGIARAEQDRLKSGAERFGDMSKSDQQRAINIKRKIDRAEQADATGNTALGEQIRKGISREDRSFIGGLGLRSTDRFHEKAAIESARRGGFFGAFREEESRGIIGAQTARARQIDAQIAGKIDFVVRMEQDADATAKAIASQIELQTKAWILSVLKTVRDENRKMLADINKSVLSQSQHKALQAQSNRGRP